jgi:hypothetical protein
MSLLFKRHMTSMGLQPLQFEHLQKIASGGFCPKRLEASTRIHPGP